MSAAENKRVMQSICSALEVGNGQPFVENMADDFCWRIIGNTKWSGAYAGKHRVREDLLTPLMSQFSDRYTNSPTRIIAEDDFVVVECQGKATTKAGKAYNNTYCWVIRFEGGKLRELTDYLDTELVTEALGDPGIAGQMK